TAHTRLRSSTHTGPAALFAAALSIASTVAARRRPAETAQCHSRDHADAGRTVDADPATEHGKGRAHLRAVPCHGLSGLRSACLSGPEYNPAPRAMGQP